jgi:multicomponent Na+:H+ antiporter subunit D
MALVYIWKVVEVAYFQQPDPDHEITEAPLSMLIPTWALVIASFWFGIDASTTADVATRAAETLLGVMP